MEHPVRIALDAMGGDHGPSVVIPGAALTLERRPDARFVVFGDESEVVPLLDAHPKLKAVTTFHHTEVSVKMDDKPSQALRYGRYKSSMWRAIDATKTESEIGWKAQENFDSGIEKTVRWYLDNRGWWEPIRNKVYAGERLGTLTK